MKDIAIQNLTGPPADASFTPKNEPPTASVSFGQMLKDSMDQVNRLQKDADASVSDLAIGRQTDIHQTMIAVEKAGVSFELLMQIRNKIISAYETIMRTSV